MEENDSIFDVYKYTKDIRNIEIHMRKIQNMGFIK